MKVYILQEFIDSHNSGVETNVLGVYDSKEKAQAEIARITETLKADNNFFMSYMFDEDYEDYFDEEYDTKDISENGIHMYDDGTSDEYDLYYLEWEVK